MMFSARFSSKVGQWLEHSVISTDVARALRTALVTGAAWGACLVTGHPAAAILMTPAAQNVAMCDVRGDYRGRLAMLASLTAVLSFSAFIGTVAGKDFWAATLMIGALALLSGLWRYLSSDYGLSFAVNSVLLFLIAMTQPGDWHRGLWLAGMTSLGGLGGILVQLPGWFVRPQHPLRHAVAECWVAASGFITAMRMERNEGQAGSPKSVSEKESTLRTTVDRTLRLLEAAGSQRNHRFFHHLDAGTQLAARFSMRAGAFWTALEPLSVRPSFAGLEPRLDSMFRALANSAHATALALITHRAEEFAQLEIRLRRVQDLAQLLERRLVSIEASSTDVAQVRQLLGQLIELLPAIRSTVSETVDHGANQTGFNLRLPELTGMSARSLGFWLNPPPQLDPVLVRYTLRMAVLLMLAIAAYKWFSIPHGYWLALTVLIVLQPDYGSTRQKAKERIMGTLAGGILGSLLLWVKLPAGLLVLLISLMAFCFAYFLRRRYALAVFFVTVMIVLMIEAMIPVHLELTLTRLLSTLAGAALALTGAALFWPKWERELFPRNLAAALRANRAYLETIAARLMQGQPFTGDPVAVRAKREAERANSQANASLRRLLTEPASRQKSREQAAALAAYNQRLTRTLTVLAQHLNQRKPITQPEFGDVVAAIAKAIERLADELEKGTSPAGDLQLNIEAPSGASIDDLVAYGQLSRIATEIEAMWMETGPAE